MEQIAGRRQWVVEAPTVSRRLFELSAGDRRCYLKVYSDADAMAAEGEGLRLARAAGLLVPDVLGQATTGPRSVLVLSALLGPSLEEFLLVESRAAVDAVVVELGAQLRLLHASTKSGWGPLRPNAAQGTPTWSDFLRPPREVLEDLELSVPAGLLARALEAVDDADTTTHESALVHGDFRPANVVVLPSGSVGLVDFEHAMIGDPLWDLAWWQSCEPGASLASLLKGYGPMSSVGSSPARRFRINRIACELSLLSGIERDDPRSADRLEFLVSELSDDVAGWRACADKDYSNDVTASVSQSGREDQR
ncbi:phosphotransferase family protein [Pseudonocardia oroxyli]|uniref:phosphotransferase family protein n=1 Tax=Pseudonocardia oroxyli TaxID=366584 RepID=UPI00159FC9CA|nr:aminoglycoside phosphotransferase family protein [Pseudonocardia oroxyli]